MGRRDERRLARRALVMDTAMEILAEGGLGALTIPKLARAMGASVGGLYRYFPSKEAIFVALQERAIDAFAQAQREAVSAAEAQLTGASQEVQALVRAMVAFKAFLDEAERAPTQHALIDAFLSAPTATLSEALARAIDDYMAPIVSYCDGLLEAASDIGCSRRETHLRARMCFGQLPWPDHFRKRDRIQAPCCASMPCADAFSCALSRLGSASGDPRRGARLPRRRLSEARPHPREVASTRASIRTLWQVKGRLHHAASPQSLEDT